MNDVTLINGVSGLNTRVDPVRVRYDPEAGISDLAESINITIDNTGRPGRRPGFDPLDLESYHSLFCDEGDCFVLMKQTTDARLMRVGTDLSLSSVRNGMVKDARTAFSQVFENTFYANGSQNGVIVGGISYTWPTYQYTGPPTTRQFFPAPIGNHLAFSYKCSRIFIAVGNTVYWCEPYKYGLFELKQAFWNFPSRVLMIVAVDTGMFISDEEVTWFYRFDNDPAKASIPTIAADYPALEWSLAIEKMEGMDIIGQPGLCAMWSSPEGSCLGTAAGLVENRNDDKVIYPENLTTGAGLLYGDNFIQTMR